MDPEIPPTSSSWFSRLASSISTISECPYLYRLTAFFVAVDLLLITFHNTVTAVLVFFLLLCFLPQLPRVLNALGIVIGNGGASEDDIRALPKCIFRQSAQDLGRNCSKMDDELVLSSEDSECCICLDRYEEGVRLCTLPCNHHFHHQCIGEWLRINAICPLCKCHILQVDMLV